MSTFLQDIEAEAKKIADAIHAAATGSVAQEVESIFPTLGGFLAKIAINSTMASAALTIIPFLQDLAAAASAAGIQGEDANQMAEDDKKFHYGDETGG